MSRSNYIYTAFDFEDQEGDLFIFTVKREAIGFVDSQAYPGDWAVVSHRVGSMGEARTGDVAKWIQRPAGMGDGNA